MALKCADGFRKPPKYLCEPPPKVQKTCSYRNEASRRASQDGVIDPAVLHANSPSSGTDSSAETGLSWQAKNNALCFSDKLQHSPWESMCPEMHQPTENVSTGLLSESLSIGTLIPPASNLDGCDVHNIMEVHGSGSSYGFTISSGWCSTFFPCGMEEENEEPKAITMAVGGTECATWGLGMVEGSRANWLC